eukprot:gnl/TRDRNA2_/TRDRNA2_183305_c0_seq1.p1 gnl/TRDRNA2_/TRDRNA2_183305_c0~~gnl/TRDRNA2_/TRDRNA2_183305_c0_seq1.p1  ORF type:complete len:703 (+),score=102.20 gnl/TRDRNA2_/TRDRNA2_183305_c0_seq1:36-2144(+)
MTSKKKQASRTCLSLVVAATLLQNDIVIGLQEQESCSLEEEAASHLQLTRLTSTGSSKLGQNPSQPTVQGYGNDVCMLVPVHDEHFSFLASRLRLQSQLIEGPTVPTVVVFDDEVGVSSPSAFCQKFPVECKLPGFIPVTLSGLLGESLFNYTWHRLMTAEGAAVNPRINPGSPNGTAWMGSGRVWQTLKKFYGAAFARPECGFYMVSDAESFPFKKHNLSHWLQESAKKHMVVSAEWYPDRFGCSGTLGDWQDEVHFLNIVAEQLKLVDIWPTKRAHQFEIQPDQYWMYHPHMVRRLLSFTEERVGMSFPAWLAEMSIGDSALHIFMAQSLHDLKDADAVEMKNIPEAFQQAFPEVHKLCSACSQESSAMKVNWYANQMTDRPCTQTIALFTPCALQRLTAKEISRFLVEELGYLGIFSQFLVDSVPLPILSGHPGLAWCVNNCFGPAVFARLLPLEGVASQELIQERRAALSDSGYFQERPAELSAADHCAPFRAGANTPLTPLKSVAFIAVVTGMGGDMHKVHEAWGQEAHYPAFLTVYVTDKDDEHLPVLWWEPHGGAQYRDRFVEFVYFSAFCAPVQPQWFVLLDDDTYLASGPLADVLSALDHEAPIILGENATTEGCGEGGVMLSAGAMEQLRNSLSVDQGSEFRAYFQKSSHHPTVTLVQYFAEKLSIFPAKESSHLRGEGPMALTAHPLAVTH